MALIFQRNTKLRITETAGHIGLVEKICEKVCAAAEISIQKKIDSKLSDIQDKIVSQQTEIEIQASTETASLNEDFRQKLSTIQTVLKELCTILSTITSVLPKNRIDQTAIKHTLEQLCTDFII